MILEPVATWEGSGAAPPFALGIALDDPRWGKKLRRLGVSPFVSPTGVFWPSNRLGARLASEVGCPGRCQDVSMGSRLVRTI